MVQYAIPQQRIIDDIDYIIDNFRNQFYWDIMRNGAARLLDDLIEEVFLYTYHPAHNIKRYFVFFIPEKILEIIRKIIDDVKEKDEILYRGIPIVPYENNEDEVYFLSTKAFTILDNNKLILTKFKGVAVGKLYEIELGKLTDKQLKLERWDRANSKFPQRLVLEELARRGII